MNQPSITAHHGHGGLPVVVVVTGDDRARSRALGAQTMLILAAHVPLALLMQHSQSAATAHALLTLAVALWCAFSGPIHRVAFAAAYIAGSEVLWRMTDASVFYEYGKYSLSLVFLLALLTRGRRFAGSPLLYFVLLLPSCLLTVTGASLSVARVMLSFNLSGPLCLMAAVMFFSQVRLSKEQLARLFIALVGPILAIAAVAFYSTATALELDFTGESNSITSGGFGPNQVASTLGLGALISLLLALNTEIRPRTRVVLIALILFFAAESALTFSRSGVYLAVCSAFFASLTFVRSRRLRRRAILVMCLICVAAIWFILPRLNAFTGGALGNRFEQTQVTQRDQLIRADLKIWQRNPMFGVGPGMGGWKRREFVADASAHTEFTRMLSEHGLLGLCALGLIFSIAISAWKRPRGGTHRGIVAACLAWSLLFMLVNAMRLAAPGFLFGLACVRLEEPTVERR